MSDHSSLAAFALGTSIVVASGSTSASAPRGAILHRTAEVTTADAPVPEATPTTALATGFVALDLGGRQYHYNDRITNGTLRPYDLPEGPLLPVVPGFAASLELFPFAREDVGLARDLGGALHGNVDFTKTHVGVETLSTRWYAWDANLRGRVHLGRRGTAPILGLEAGLGHLHFGFEEAGALAPILPSVDYKYLRIAIDGRFPLGRVALLAGLGYRDLLTTTNASGETIPSAGPIGEYFPRASISGLEANIGAILSIAGPFEARLVVHYVRFWAKFNPEAGDAHIAGGALDQFINTDLGLAASF